MGARDAVSGQKAWRKGCVTRGSLGRPSRRSGCRCALVDHPTKVAIPCSSSSNQAHSTTRRRRRIHRRLSSPRTASTEVASSTTSVVSRFLGNQDKDLVKGYRIASNYWEGMKKGQPAGYKPVVSQVPNERAPAEASNGAGPDYDVVVCGGNLGIAIALALQNRGHRVLIVERRLLRGRTQEWNASRKECMNLVRAGLLTLEELEDVIISEFNPNRVTFKGGEDVWVSDILNVGVAPDDLVETLKQRFLRNGGKIRELCEFRSATIYDDMAVIKVKDKGAGRGSGAEEVLLDMYDVNKPNAVPTTTTATDASLEGATASDTITCSLVVDCMGHFSPIVKQLRKGAKPESIVLVVGGCVTQGVPKFTTSDILASFTDAERDMQFFWETFPAKEGTTMYMFTYCDADESRVSFEKFLESFLNYLPSYCRERLEAGQEIGIEMSEEDVRAIQADGDEFLDNLKFNRLLFGAFPSYKQCPLNSPFDRLVLVGDSSAVQSPLSFGGFGAMLRHVGRLDEAIHEAIEGSHLKASDLKLVQPYMPGLGTAWLFQKAMGFEPSQMGYDAGYCIPQRKEWTRAHVNRVLKANFAAMKTMEKTVLLSFLQDTILFWPLTRTMFAMTFVDPIAILRVVYLLGPRTLAQWFVHYIMLGLYTLCDFVFGRFRSQTSNFHVRRYMDAWRYGSGADFFEEH